MEFFTDQTLLFERDYRPHGCGRLRYQLPLTFRHQQITGGQEKSSELIYLGRCSILYSNVVQFPERGNCMGIPKTVRLDDDLEKRVESYLESNGIKFSQMVNMAVAKFIAEPQTIQLAPVNTEDFMDTAKKAFKKHKSAMDKLK